MIPPIFEYHYQLQYASSIDKVFACKFIPTLYSTSKIPQSLPWKYETQLMHSPPVHPYTHTHTHTPTHTVNIYFYQWERINVKQTYTSL